MVESRRVEERDRRGWVGTVTLYEVFIAMLKAAFTWPPNTGTKLQRAEVTAIVVFVGSVSCMLVKWAWSAYQRRKVSR
jgi:hypothetical protein